ncbi:unnamed protein product [Calicophoron daubneyi]
MSVYLDKLQSFSLLNSLLDSCITSHDTSEVDNVVRVWCLFVSRGLSLLPARRANFLYKLCKSLWSKNPLIIDRIIDYTSSTPESFYTLVLNARIAEYLKSSCTAKFETQKLVFVEKFLRSLISKLYIPRPLLIRCTRVITACVDQDMFTNVVIPVLNKAILRSAEAHMTEVDAVLKQVPFELDFCAKDLAQSVVKNLSALSDIVRRDTAAVLCTIVSRCSEADAVIAVFKLAYGQMTGPDGKKAGQTSLLEALKCLGEMSSHGVKRSSASERIANVVVAHFLDYLEQETHEETLIYASKQLSKWVCQFRSNLPERFYSFIKTKAFNAKVAPSVRCAYLACMDSGFHKVKIGDRMPVPVTASLLTTVQRAFGQPNHSPIVFESACASLLWLRHFVAKSSPLTEEKIKSDLIPTPVWAMLVGTSATGRRRPWFSERFLQSAPDSVLAKLARLIELAIRDLYEYLPPETLSSAYRILLLLAIHPHYTAVRKPALDCVRAILSCTDDRRWIHAKAFLVDLFTCLLDDETEPKVTKPSSEEAPSAPVKSQKVSEASASSSTVQSINFGPRLWNEVNASRPESQTAPGQRERLHVVSTYLTRLITELVCVPASTTMEQMKEGLNKSFKKHSSDLWDKLPVDYWQKVTEAYITAVFASSHPIISTGMPRFWEQLRHRLGLPDLFDDSSWISLLGDEFVASKWAELVNLFLDLPCLDQAHGLALWRLVSWSPTEFGRTLINAVMLKLSHPSFLSASEREVQIMLTPDSQLYNHELLEGLPIYQKSDANIKRESKLYSYDVQMDIVAAQKEREKIAKRTTGSAEQERPLLEVLAEQLTEKQLSAVRVEMEKEAEIRRRMIDADAKGRHLSAVLTDALSACLSSKRRFESQSALAIGNLVRSSCPDLSRLLSHLISSPLMSPYVLRAFVQCVVLCLECAASPHDSSSHPDHECMTVAPMIGWWSVRILGPARLLHRSDLTLLINSSGRHLSGSRVAHLAILERFVEDSVALTVNWSTQTISQQTSRVLSFLSEKFPTPDVNAILLCSVLSPAFEFLLLASGWARPLVEEIPGLTFPGIIANTSEEKDVNKLTGIPASVLQKWNWVNSQHVHDLLTICLRQLRNANESLSTSLPANLKHELMMRVVPFHTIFRVMRQVVEGCLHPDGASASTDRLPTDDVPEDSTPASPDRADEVQDEASKALAVLAMDVLRAASQVVGVTCASDPKANDTVRLVNVSLEVLILGLVSETAEAREICASCILLLCEAIPSLTSVIGGDTTTTLSVPESNPQSQNLVSDDPAHGENEAVMKEDLHVSADVAAEQSTVDEPDTKASESTAKSKKKPSKGQRRKYKQAQAAAGVGDVHVEDRPYDNPALWPSLTIWPCLQLRIWVARSDLSPEVATLAERLWIAFGLDAACEQQNLTEKKQEFACLIDSPKIPSLLPPLKLANRLLLEVTRPVLPVQQATADAFAVCLLNRSPQEISAILDKLIQLYRVMLHRDPAVKDSIGRTLIPESADRWQERVGLAFALSRLPEALNPSEGAWKTLRKGQLTQKDQGEEKERDSTDTLSNGRVEDADVSRKADTWLLNMFRFLVPDGLNDRNDTVRSEMLQAGLRAVAIFGKAYINQLLPILETFINKAPNVAELDAVRQSVLVLTGSLAQHLDADNPKVVNIFNRLLSTLNFPSDVVQQAVEDCLASLITKLPEEQVSKTITRLMTTLLGSSGYAERHGAAHGIAGVARGLGIMSLKHYGIVDKLLPALEDTKSSKRREGALLAIERLCLGMGRLFEPYVIRLISGLLNSFGDANPGVREAASNTARAVMSKLSAHGVRLILPALLRAIDDQQSWRTKAESVELLGTMTNCAPKQLSACLPQIVPRLIEVLADSQDRVKQAGMRALKQIGSVIRNPEVQALVPMLTNSLQNPLANKMPCLLALRDTCFVHVLDAPSLALILPVIQRAFNERSTEARKTAAQIFGNLHSLARKEELQPYVGSILPPLKTCLLDAVPEVRSVAAAALGALVRGMGEQCFKELLPWLIETLTSESSSVDRSGAAQGMAEVLGAMGIDRLRAILPDLIQTASTDAKIQPHVRDGYLMLFIYLPAVFQDSFSEFIGPIIPMILRSLSDETEFLRETALRAGQQIVHLFAETSIELILPELERGMGDNNWRIRHSSVQLVGDLLYQVSGLSGKGTTKTQNEDDTFGTTEAQERLRVVLGEERHNRVLARLHMARSDPTLIVRQAAVHVWKIVVANTSRTLREIMPVLIKLLLDTLGSSNREQQQLSARALGDVVKKLGERILPEIIPLLVLGLDSPDADQRRGVCTGLMEIMRSCQREQLINYADGLLVPIRRTLCDPLPEVRRSGARTFDILYGSYGVRSLDGILPDLLAHLDDPESSSFALDGLKQLLVVRGRAVMPYLVPKLTYPTINVKAFAYLASVAGDALGRQLSRILPALLTTVSQLAGQPTEEEDLHHCASVLVCIYDAGGVRYIFNELLSGLMPAGAGQNTAPTSSQYLAPDTPAYRNACLRLLSSYLEASYEPDLEDADAERPAANQGAARKGKKGESGDESDERSSIVDDDDEEEEDDDEDVDSNSEVSEEEDENSEDLSTDSDLVDEEEVPDAKETIERVLREFYPTALRNICRLLAFKDKRTLSGAWRCLEALFKRWSPETVSTQLNDLRQGIRGAVSEMHKSRSVVSRDNEFLPGLSDPDLPLASLVKLYADCTLHGRADMKEPAAQGLSECITHASGAALQRCVVKVIGPLIRLLGERQTNVVRMAVVDSLTLLVNKCPMSARPFVTQLQATFLKCLGDTHRAMRLLGGQGLASIVGITPKLDPLLIDLARVPVHTVLTNWPGEHIPGDVKPDNLQPTIGGAATALTLAGVAAYPETSLQALRVCLIGSTGRASLSALNSVISYLSPLMCLPNTNSGEQSKPVEEEIEDEEEDEENNYGIVRPLGNPPKGSDFNPDAVRIAASTCIGCTMVAGEASLSKQPNPSGILEPVRMLEGQLFPTKVDEAYDHWAFQQSRAVALLIALKFAPRVVINEHSVEAGITAKFERLISDLCASSQSVVCQLGFRCIGCYVGYVVETPQLSEYNLTSMMQLLAQGLTHEMIDIRLLITVVASHIAWRSTLSDPNSSSNWLPGFLNVLLAGTRERNNGVRIGSETALAILCRFGAPPDKNPHASGAIMQRCVECAESGSRAPLDAILHRLRKQTWTAIWAQGCPDMDSTVVL